MRLGLLYMNFGKSNISGATEVHRHLTKAAEEQGHTVDNRFTTRVNRLSSGHIYEGLVHALNVKHTEDVAEFVAGVDIIVVQEEALNDFTPTQIDILRGKPLVGIFYNIKTVMMLEPGVLDAYDVILTDSLVLQEWARKEHSDKDFIYVKDPWTRLGVHQTGHDSITLCFPGRFDKHLDAILYGARFLPEERHHIVSWDQGAGFPYVHTFLKEQADWDPTRIEYTGKLMGKAKLDALQRCQFLIDGSWGTRANNGPTYASIEAMDCGLIPVMADRWLKEDIVSHESAILLPTDEMWNWSKHLNVGTAWIRRAQEINEAQIQAYLRETKGLIWRLEDIASGVPR